MPAAAILMLQSSVAAIFPDAVLSLWMILINHLSIIACSFSVLFHEHTAHHQECAKAHQGFGFQGAFCQVWDNYRRQDHAPSRRA
jgi:hypothetical protein